MSEFQAPDRTNHAAFIALAVMSAQVLSVFQPHAIPFDHEELYNAVHARLIQLGHMDYLLNLQYRGHCGGCTQHALLGSGLFSILGHSLFVWKLVPVLWVGAMAYAGARFLRQQCGLLAAVLYGTLLLFPPPTFLELSLSAWGNHFESGVAAVVVLWLTSRVIDRPSVANSLSLGLSLSWALWIGFSSVFLLLALPFLIWKKTQARHLIGITCGLSAIAALWYYQHSRASSSPFETIYYAGESIPAVTRIPAKLWSIVAPRQLVALFGLPDSTWGWAAGVATGILTIVSGWLTRSNPGSLLVSRMLGAFLVVYCTVRFTVWTPPYPEIAPPGSMRYAAPMFGLGFMLLSMACASAWNGGKHLLALGIILPSLCVGIHARAEHFEAPFPDKSVFRMAAPDFHYARDQAGYTITLADHAGCDDEDPHVQAFHAYAIGWHEARAILDQDPSATLPAPSTPHEAGLQGLAAALLSEIDPDEDQGPRSLNMMLTRLGDLPEPQQLTVLLSAARRRHWNDALPSSHDEERVLGFTQMVSLQPTVIQRALTRAFGHSWAEDLTRWRVPRTLPVPSLEALAHPEDFVVGFAETIGERWGHGPWPYPDGLVAHEDTWTRHVTRGANRRWLSPAR